MMKKTVILCIGNRDGGDDAVGPYIADGLKRSESDNLICIDAGIAPENFTSVVKNHQPKRLLIIDAVEMGLKPGKIRQVPSDRIGVMHVSTHGIPLSVLIKYLRQYMDSIILIGIQPKTMSGKLTDEVKKSADQLIQFIISDSIEKISTLL